METNDRINQWENMTQADPQNAMGWFSLGNAYKDAGRKEDAVRAFARSIELDHGLSRAYQLLGGLHIDLGQTDDAQRVLTQGYTTAAARGDVMPQRAMASLLQKIGVPLPRVQEADVPKVDPSDANAVLDRKTGRPGARLADPPMRGPVGQLIYENYSQETWREWIGMGTKVINELRLDFSNVEHQKVYEQHMLEWLGISPEEVQQYAQKAQQQGK